MLWRGPDAADNQVADPVPQPPRIIPRKQFRARQEAALADAARARVGPRTEPTPPVLAPSTVPELADVQQLLRRAESVPNASAADLRRRVEELGPIPEVIDAIQEILRAQNIEDVELPLYEEERMPR
jgi:hypothetical protein